MRANRSEPSIAIARFFVLALCTLANSRAVTSPADGAAAAGESVKLAPFEVRSDRTSDADYQTDSIRTATKTDTALQDVPQSITVVTADQILDQQMTSLEDLVRYVPGVTSHQGENNRDQLIFRGNSSSADFFLNGMRDDVQYYRDLYNLDRVEVLRGPNAMIFGRGGGGGIINRVTKQADFAPRDELTLQGGSFGDGRAAIDVDQPLSSQTAARFNAVYEHSGSFRDFVDLKRYGMNPTVTFIPERQTRITLGYEHLHDTRVADRGITSYQGRPADVPIETYYGNPADSQVHALVDLVTATIEHSAGKLRIFNQTIFGDYDRGYQNFVPGAVTADKSSVALTAYNNATHRRNLFNQTDLTYRTASGEIRHALLAGVEWGRQLTDNFRNTGFFGDDSTTILVPYGNPTTTTPVTWRQSATDANNHLRTDLAAAYVQDQVEFTRRWQAIAGLRFDSFDLQYHDNRNGDDLSRRDDLISPRAGLIYKPGATMSLYGNYSVSYLPSSGDQFASLTTVTQQMEPEKFTNYELGAKCNLRGQTTLTLALYRLDRTHTRATDPSDPSRILQTGSQRTKGFEFGLNGRISPAWTATAGYAYQDAFISNATAAAPAGAKVAQVPRHSLSLWNRWRLLPEMSLGLGLVHRSAMFAAIDDTVLLPGYTTVDAAIYYTVNHHWRLQANVEDLLNVRYYINADSNTNISPGSPRAIRLSIAGRF
ncbi:MAG TPA: TonB-dependent siderophore receptor [Opitutaceae bacterium]|nr:TonB-dependent siderophore receptor [Opitutaceae bacterium]